MEKEKITDYLLCAEHPDGHGKAAFFERFGFSVKSWTVFMEALRKHGQDNAVVSVVESPYGVRYVVEGPLDVPKGIPPHVRTVWIIEKGDESPRLVTAYPIQRKEES